MKRLLIALVAIFALVACSSVESRVEGYLDDMYAAVEANDIDKFSAAFEEFTEYMDSLEGEEFNEAFAAGEAWEEANPEKADAIDDAVEALLFLEGLEYDDFNEF